MYLCASRTIQARIASSAVVPSGRSRSARPNSSIAISNFWKTTSSLAEKYEKNVRGEMSAAAAMSAIVVAS